ncbi:outer membrane receptor protein involved in Fe transport [Dyadobacter jejuensis]|uniref:Outer membrane receptor protein involved in Fe transport n=1 Tax=Dyadobacter jejuensis TaxID=1082580 RepID=A0A316AGF1_9BACT|nr:outer membrane beta-barrel family protein [Dyadobacter jejuensis]PWJ56691.1 outer membrane receptor protein involved in Fe transport [Dyadobacter jejuensis]
MKQIITIFLFTLLVGSVTAQSVRVTLSGKVVSHQNQSAMSYVNIALFRNTTQDFVVGSISDERGQFVLTDVAPGTYQIRISYLGFLPKTQELVIGNLSPYLNLGTFAMEEDPNRLEEVTITGRQPDGVSAKMDKKVYDLGENISQIGGSVLDAMKNLPGVTLEQDGKVSLRGSDKVAVLIDGRQTAITGFGNQTGLDNLPASSIERIEIINNPSAKFDANGNAGIINIIYKKNKDEGFNGKIGLTAGLGALWIKKQNLPEVGKQYQNTPKINPSLSLNYKKNRVNWFLQGDYLHTPTLNKNEFVDRTYDDGTIVRQQTRRNRDTNFSTLKTGLDWSPTDKDLFSLSGLFSREKILDHGEEPFYNKDLTVRNRLWTFLEDELKTTATASASYQHKYQQPGRLLTIGLNYTFHREDEKYFFKNTLPDSFGEDAFKLLSDEHVGDLTVDYVQPMRYGRVEGGLKLRRRYIPTNMQFFPGANSPIDSLAGGWANYNETIPAVYGNYVYENQRIELEAGMRFEFVDLRYTVNPSHPTYKSNGYTYSQPFPNLRFAYKFDDHNKLSIFYNRRVDRPNEVDIRIFPKYDDAEIIKIGNPALSPQFTSTIETGYKSNWEKGYFYSALYYKFTNHTITRIGTIVPGSTIIYNIFQNAGNSSSTGVELLAQHQLASWLDLSLNVNVYRNNISAFTVQNLYPIESMYTAAAQSTWSGNGKLIGNFKFKSGISLQLSALYMAPDVVPQGRTGSRYGVDMGAKKQLPKGDIFLNASDLFNTMVTRRTVIGDGFHYTSNDYYETQVIRIGYHYKF